MGFQYFSVINGRDWKIWFNYFAASRYGLIDVKTGKVLTVSDVFNNDSDSDGENGGWLKKSHQVSGF